MKKIGDTIKYSTHWEDPKGDKTGTIIGYDIFMSKYKIAKHSFDGVVMHNVIDWIFIIKP